MSKSTETIAMKNNPYGVAEWRSGISTISAPAISRDREVAEFFNNLWPAAESYVSALNPVFLLDLPKMDLAQNGSWLVRDGLLPILWFFKNNPSPASFRGRLQVHAEFEEYVPDAWRPQVELYRFFSASAGGYLPKAKKAQPIRNLLLLGLIAPSVCSLPTLSEELKEILRLVGGKKGIENCSIKAVLPLRFENMHLFNGQSYYNRFVLNICRELGTQIDFMEYDAFRASYPAEDTWFHEFNDRWLYADSYMSLVAQSKSCRVLPLHKGELTESYDRILPAFPHVSCGVRKVYKKKFLNYLEGNWIAESEERAKRYYSAMNSAANISYPWPNWFSSWCGEVTQRG